MKMGKKVREYKSGDFIFAKVKGYPAWPARVQRLNGKKYFVYFYGTGETANLPPNMIFDYAENKDKFLTKTVKRKDFNLGVKQIEHDFANNVPVEEVVGIALLQDTSVNDTINESAANETMDESAVTDDDTTTVNETTEDTSTSQNDTGVDDSDETGGLVIDEGKKGRKSTKAATPAKPVKEPRTPRGKAKKEEQKEEAEEKKEEEIISRSGRKIRPKRYLDEHTEENTTLPSPAPKKRRVPSPAPEKEKEPEKEKPKPDAVKTKTEKTKLFNTVSQSELEDLKEPFAQEDADKENILIAYLGSGQYVGIRLFQSRPATFKNEAGRLQWDKQAATNALNLKMQLERGQITPQSVMGQLVTDLHLTDEEKATLDKERETEEKKSRVQFLKTEMKVVDLNAKIKTCLCLEKADTELCLKLLDELMELDLKALMLLKHPSCLETVKRMRAYVGNTNSWDLSESAALHFNKQAQRIRKQADLLYKNMKELFTTPAGLSFFEFFSERVLEFQKVTAKLTADELLEMVHEPIEMSAPTQLTSKTLATKDDEAAPATEDDNTKKINNNTPTKTKKTNGTQAKPPLKRQSSRKQQQEEKETTEKEQEDKEEIPADKTNEKPEESKDTNTEENIAEEEAPESVTKEKEQTETTEIEKEQTESTEMEKEQTESSEIEKEQTESTEIEKETDTKEKSPSPVKECEKSPKNDEKTPQKKTEEKVEVKQKEKVEVKEKEKEKPDVDEPRAKRTRESRKTEPPSPRSPSKRKQKL